MKCYWNPYTYIKESEYSLAGSIGNYIKVFVLKTLGNSSINSVIVPIDWPMGILFKNKKGLRGFIPKNMMPILGQSTTVDNILIREPENLKVVAKARARFITKNTVEVYEVNGEVKDYYLLDLSKNIWRDTAEKLLMETLEMKPRLLYALRAEIPNSLKLLKRSVPPGSFILVLPCKFNRVVSERYKLIENTLRGFTKVLCTDLE